MNKERARLVPAAVVKPALRVIGALTDVKTSVAGPDSPSLNLAA